MTPSTSAAAPAPRDRAGRSSATRPVDQVAPFPWWLTVFLGAVGGFCAILAFPPYDQWYLLPIGIALLTATTLTRRWPGALLGSWAWGLAFFIPLTEWASTYAGLTPWLALAVVQSLYIVLYGLLTRTIMIKRGLGPLSLLLATCMWVAVETFRSHVPWGGLPWGASGFALSESPLLNYGPWVGMAGLAFIVAAIGHLLLYAVLGMLGRVHGPLTGAAGIAPLAVAAAVMIASVVVPSPAIRGTSQTMQIAGVQGSMDPIDPVTLAMPPEVFVNNVTTTRQAIAEAEEAGASLDLIVWAEDSAPGDPRRDWVSAEELTVLSAEAQAPILVGTQAPVGESQRTNDAVLWTEEIGATWTYTKRHPVPFGEYVPWRNFLRKLSPLVDLIERDMIAGESVGILLVPDTTDPAGADTPVGVLICFEIAYENLVRDVVMEGGEVIVVQSNNALFGDSNEAIQQLAEAKVFSVISGRSVVHVSSVGHSAIFDPYGRRLDFVDHWEQGVVSAEVPRATTITPAMAIGPYLTYGIIAIAVLGWLIALFTRERKIRRLPAAHPSKTASGSSAGTASPAGERGKQTR